MSDTPGAVTPAVTETPEEKRKRKGREYRARNRERIRANDRVYYQRHKEKLKAKSRQWQLDNADRYRHAQSEWHAARRKRLLATPKATVPSGHTRHQLNAAFAAAMHYALPPEKAILLKARPRHDVPTRAGWTAFRAAFVEAEKSVQWRRDNPGCLQSLPEIS